MPPQTAEEAVNAGEDSRFFADVMNGIVGQYFMNRAGYTLPSLATKLATVTTPIMVKTAREYGAIGDGLADDTQAIQAAFDSGYAIMFTQGTYKITSQLNLRTGLQVLGCGRGAALKQMFNGNLCFGNAVTDVQFSDLHFIVGDASLTGCNAVYLQGCQRCHFRGLTSEAVAFVSTWFSGGGGAPYTDPDQPSFNGCRFITIDDCHHIGSAPNVGLATCLICFTLDWSISNCTFEKTGTGIQWWGGDSKPGAYGGAGDLQNDRQCKRGMITNVNVNDVFAGIWGSMGQYITVANCTVKNCADVALDDEGGFDNVFVNNFAQNGGNGTLATFWLTQRASFVGNTVVGTACFLSHNATNAPIPTASLIGNRFISLSGFGYVSTQAGMGELVLDGNSFWNVSLNLAQINQGTLRVLRNRMIFSIDIPTGFVAMSVGGNQGNVLIEGITIERTGGNLPDPGSTGYAAPIALAIGQGDYNVGVITTVRRSRLSSFPISLSVAGGSPNPGVLNHYVVEENDFIYGVLRNTLQVNSGCFIRRNYDGFGHSNPAAAPTTGSWDGGCIEFNYPSNSAYFGVVCVTPGQPGTWRAYGPTGATATGASADPGTQPDSGGA